MFRIVFTKVIKRYLVFLLAKFYRLVFYILYYLVNLINNLFFFRHLNSVVFLRKLFEVSFYDDTYMTSTQNVL